jgi:hypothetical protein
MDLGRPDVVGGVAVVSGRAVGESLGMAVPVGAADSGHLIRSADGLDWDQLAPTTPCDVDLPAHGFSPLVPLGDGWVTTYNCVDMGEPHVAEAYAVDAAGEVSGVPGTRRDDASYGGVARVGDAVVVMASRADGSVDAVRLTR